MSIRRDFPDIPPVWAAGVLAVQWVAARWLPLLRFDAGWTGVLGWALVVVGIALAVWAALWFRRKRTSIEPRDRPTALIVEGPFRIDRNPIYAGMALVLIGAGLVLGALSSVALAFAFPWIATRRFILGEEDALRETFGAEAEAYIARTRRW